MSGAVNVRIVVFVKVRNRVDYTLRLLCCGGIIEPHERLAMNSLFQDREIFANGGDVERCEPEVGAEWFTDKPSRNEVPTSPMRC